MTPQQKIRYLQAYIHYMKNKRVEINLPVGAEENLLMNQAYMYALQNMNSMGKKINI